MKATEAFLHKCVIFISTPIYKSSFLFSRITLHQWYLSKTKIKPMSMNLSPPPEGQVCTHVPHVHCSPCMLGGSLATAHTFCISISCPHVRSRPEK